MTPADFFYISVGLGIWISVVTWFFIIYKIIRFFTSASQDIKSAKNTLKLSGLTLLSKLLSSVKVGEK